MAVTARESWQPRPSWVPHPWVEASTAEIRFGIANGPRGDWSALAEFVLPGH